MELVITALRRLLRLFFRRIEVVGEENVPAEGGGVLIAWHPNGLLDPALILAHFPRRVVFGARDGLLRWPLFGRLLRFLGTVPIYRPQDSKRGLDPESRRAANRRSLDALAEAVARGSFAALFPEGESHDEPMLMDLRPGAARLYLAALERTPLDSPPPVVIPVGLHYDRKHLFGSTALVEFHPPLELPPEVLEAPTVAIPGSDPADDLEARTLLLTHLFDRTLSDVVQETESWELYHLMHRLRKIFRAERASRAGARPGKTTLQEKVLGFARVRSAYLTLRESRPEETARLEERVRSYDRTLEALGLEDHELGTRADLASPWRTLLLVAQAIGVYLLLPPLLILGYVVNTPVALALGAFARRTGGKIKDQASIKVIVGLLVFPVVWLATSLLVAWGQINLHGLFPGRVPEAPWLAGVVTFLLCSVGGLVAVRYLRLARETYRAIRVRLTRAMRRRAVNRLARERAVLFEAAQALAQGLELPGEVTPEGRITAVGSHRGP
jgi:glycerol-3-phosphate O-acyltransferase / dihydroxyacetone phosphate acyltransferase